MKNYPNILLIGGATRNVGKTTFTKAVIKHFATQHSIIGLKIKTLRKGDEHHHGKGRHQLDGDFLVVEESFSSEEDTGKMFDAGAKQVFHIKAKEDSLESAFQEFIQNIPPESMIVCESNSLRKIIEPGIFLLIKHLNHPNEMKPSARELEPLANHIIFTNGISHNFVPEQISINTQKWQLLLDKR